MPLGISGPCVRRGAGSVDDVPTGPVGPAPSRYGAGGADSVQPGRRRPMLEVDAGWGLSTGPEATA